MTESTKTGDEVKEPVKSKRDQDYDALLAKRAESRQEPEPEPEPEPKPQIETIDLIGEDGNPVKVPIKAKYKAKIDGDEVEVTFDKLARSYQVGAAADKRMKDVSEKQKELERKEQDLELRGQELTKKEQAYLENQKKLDEGNKAGDLDDEKYQRLSKQLLSAFTDEEDPEEAIKSVLKEIAPKEQDLSKVALEAEERALKAVEDREKRKAEEAEAKRQEDMDRARLEANEKFEAALDKEFKLLKEDESLMRLAKAYANDEYHKNPEKDPWEVIKGSVDKVIAFKTRLTPETKKPPVVPKGVSARASIGEDKKPLTRAEILNQMKQSRGQPVAL